MTESVVLQVDNRNLLNGFGLNGLPVIDPQAEQAKKYPAYWKPLPTNWAAIDTYRLGVLFPVDDPSGRILHARKKLLVPGVRTGGKSMRKDIQEAVSSLQAWLDDNPEA